MNSTVERIIAGKEQEKRRRLDLAKEELAEKLLKEDYFDREYVEADPKLNHLYEKEEQTDGSVRYWKKVKLELTDEEFEKLRGYYSSDRYEPEIPPLVGVIQVVAWAILAAALLIGLSAGGAVFIFALLGAVPLTVLFLAFAEIVKKLNNIEKLLKKDK